MRHTILPTSSALSSAPVLITEVEPQRDSGNGYFYGGADTFASWPPRVTA
jgi:hypothetical protein